VSGPEPWDVVVVVPARDEADRITACVASVLAAVRAAPVRRGVVVVVADACTDDTAARARAALGPAHVVLEVAHRSAGQARRDGVEAGLARLRGFDAARTWIAATDADTRVPPDWLAHHLAQARRGWTAVAGIVAVDDFSEHPAHVAEAFRRHYRFDADGAHEHVHGANLGCRADAYLDVGGWPPLALHEDRELWGALRRRGWPAAATARSSVTTSGRAIGRAVGGFADVLRSLGAGGPGGAARGTDDVARPTDAGPVPALG
jgi:glycosyltransferase involved in cell wall biosynthesis